MTNYIWVTAEKEILHNYPSAPKKVFYLRNIHRHLFKFKVWISVGENDRDIEFIMFKHTIENILNRMVKDLPMSKSCEMMANYIHKNLIKYKRTVRIEVSEDGENGIDFIYKA